MQLGRKFTQPSKQAGDQGSSMEPEVEDSRLNNGRLKQAEAIGKSLDCMRQWEDMHVNSVFGIAPVHWIVLGVVPYNNIVLISIGKTITELL